MEESGGEDMELKNNWRDALGIVCSNDSLESHSVCASCTQKSENASLNTRDTICYTHKGDEALYLKLGLLQKWTVANLPNSTSERSAPLEKSLEQFPFISLLLLDLESEAQALATDWTRCSSSAFLQPHQLTSGCPQREMTAPLLWCLKTNRIERTSA